MLKEVGAKEEKEEEEEEPEKKEEEPEKIEEELEKIEEEAEKKEEDLEFVGVKYHNATSALLSHFGVCASIHPSIHPSIHMDFSGIELYTYG